MTVTWGVAGGYRVRAGQTYCDERCVSTTSSASLSSAREAGMKKRCANCGSTKFGLIRHRLGSLEFCKLKCKQVWQSEHQRYVIAHRRWTAISTHGPTCNRSPRTQEGRSLNAGAVCSGASRNQSPFPGLRMTTKQQASPGEHGHGSLLPPTPASAQTRRQYSRVKARVCP
jgi:hypothetical protein